MWQKRFGRVSRCMSKRVRIWQQAPALPHPGQIVQEWTKMPISTLQSVSLSRMGKSGKQQSRFLRCIRDRVLRHVGSGESSRTH